MSPTSAWTRTSNSGRFFGREGSCLVRSALPSKSISPPPRILCRPTSEAQQRKQTADNQNKLNKLRSLSKRLQPTVNPCPRLLQFGRAPLRRAFYVHLPRTRPEPIVSDFLLQMTWYVVGHRAWLGHKKRVTIPLWRLPGIENGDWETYQSELRRWDFYGAPRNRTAEPFAVPVYGNPVPNCMCQPKGGPLPFNSRACKSDAYKCIDER
jgi:hypothetical protein